MTNSERAAIRQAADRISNLASLEKAHFTNTVEKDREVKNEIRPYMAWFECIAQRLTDLCEADENGDRYSKKGAIEDIIKYCR